MINGSEPLPSSLSKTIDVSSLKFPDVSATIPALNDNSTGPLYSL